MAESETEAEYKQAFIERVKSARIATGEKQWEVALVLGIPQDKYKQYEGRSLMPHHLIDRFCLHVRVNTQWLISGRGKRALQPLKVITEEPVAPARPKRTRVRRTA